LSASTASAMRQSPDQPEKSVRARVAIIQNRLAPFRVAFFNRLAQTGGIDLTVFCSDAQMPTAVAATTSQPHFALRPLGTIALGRLALHPALPCAILAGKFQVVVAEARLGLLSLPLVLFLCRLTGKRFLWWTCGWEPDEARSLSEFKRAVRRFLCRAADGGIAYSNTARAYLISLGTRPENTWVAHNSLDTESLLGIEKELLQETEHLRRLKAEHNAANRSVVLFVGKLTQTKRVDLLLRAFEKVHQVRPEAVLWIVGDGPEKSRLEEIARQCGELPVRFFGEITEPRAISSLYMAADVFALPGTGGLAINQAMTFGKPVVVSSADGTEEDLVTDGVNGLYFATDDADDLAAKILQLLDDPALRARMGQRSREIILTKINMTNMVNSFCDASFNRRVAP
jgi:glycosyltransferase involved in cell wall biosynthesis